MLKPFSLAQLLNAVKRCFERSRLQQENYVLRREVTAQGGLEGLVGQSEAMRLVCERLKRIAPTPSTVLLLGESGTGKEVAARAAPHEPARRWAVCAGELRGDCR